jgi:23S rRNA G2445 N2-methylase RlmL
VNLACGSGTLLIERLALGPARRAIGCDLDARALACARENLAASGLADAVSLALCDAGRAPLPSGCATTVCVDLPFGMLLGSHQANEQLYPRLLAEAGRLAAARGMLAAITQEGRLFERVAAAQEDCWSLLRTVPIKLPANTRDGYSRPRIYVLQRR